MPSQLHCASWLVSILLACPFPSPAIDSPLSDTAVREAYFLGQRRDETLGRFLDKYTLRLAEPKAGPYIQAVTLLTPFALLVDYSSRQSNYSAQQAQLDHKKMAEMIRLTVQISLTDSYGPYLMRPTGSRSGSPTGIQLRRSDFWRDFRVRLLSDDGLVKPSSGSGEPTYRCDDYGGCILSGAIVQFDYPAESVSGANARVEIEPPEGEPIAVEFDLASLR